MSPSPPAEMTASDLRDRPFYCRQWVFQRLQHCLEGLGGARAPGILITGAPGAGKTALCTEILCPSSEAGRNSRLGARVLAHYFCQAHTHASLDPQHFIHSVARQLRRSPLIRGYRGGADTDACKGDLNETFKRLVLLPLAELPPPSQNLLLLVDSVDEMCCCCRSDGFGAESSCTIAELLANHHELLPPWLLLVCTARRQNKTVTRMFTGPVLLSLNPNQHGGELRWDLGSGAVPGITEGEWRRRRLVWEDSGGAEMLRSGGAMEAVGKLAKAPPTRDYGWNSGKLTFMDGLKFGGSVHHILKH